MAWKNILLGEEEEKRIGRRLGEVLGMTRDREYPDRWRTDWGTKTDLGLYLSLQRVFDELETNGKTDML